MERKGIQTITTLVFIASIIAIFACTGGRVIEFDDIQGPDSMKETAIASFTVYSRGGMNTSYLWSVDPPDAGDFDRLTTPTTNFQATPVELDTPIKINATVTTDQLGPTVISKDVSVLNRLGWARTWGGLTDDWSGGVHVSDDGFIYAVSSFSGTVDFDPGPEEELLTATVLQDLALSKFTEEGDLIWANNYGSQTNNYVVDLTTDSYGNLYLLSWESDFNPEYSYASLMKVDPNGEVLSTFAWHGMTLTGVAIAESGDIYLSGEFSSTVDFDPNAGQELHTSAHPVSACLISLDSNGSYSWGRSWDADYANRIALHGSNLYVGGGYSKLEVDFDPGPGEDFHSNFGSDDSYIAKFDSNGEFIWAKTWGGSKYDGCFSVETNDFGDLFAIGPFSENLDLDPGPGQTFKVDNGEFLSKFDADGNLAWVKTWDSSISINDLRLDDSGNVFLVGDFYKLTDFDPGDGEAIPNGSTGGFLCKIDSEGEFQWVTVWLGYFVISVDVDIAENDYSYITGFYNYQVDFDPGPAREFHISNGDSDCFLLKIAPDGDW